MGLWLLARPYTGVRHDGILYLGQILLQTEPEVFSRDLFFAYGSQDQFSVFSTFSAWLHTALGLERSQFALLMLGHATLLLACAWLLRLLASLELRVMGLAALAVLPHYYGGWGVFSYAEGFVTARTLAEPLALLSLASLVHQRFLLAVVAGLAAAALHPLVVLPAWFIGWLWLALRDCRWLGLALPAALAPLLLAWAGREPFAQLLNVYDAEWLSVVESITPFVFVRTWTLSSWSLSLGLIAFLGWAARYLPEPLAGLARATALGAAMLLLFSVVGADLANNMLLTQLQLWRGLWLAHALSVLLLPTLLLHLWRRGLRFRPAAFSLGAAAIALTAEWSSSLLIAGWACAMLTLAYRSPTSLTDRAWSLLHDASLAVLLLLSTLLYSKVLLKLTDLRLETDLSVLVWSLAATPLVAGGLALVAITKVPRMAVARSLGVALCAAMLIAGITQWDRRGPFQRLIETRPPTPHPFALKTPPDSQIYWRDSLLLTWAMLGRSSYFTDHQGSGALFKRGTALEFDYRRRILAPLSLQNEICMILNEVTPNDAWQQDCVPDLELITEICQSERGPDYLVFPFALERGVIESWTMPAPAARPVTYHLHDCAELR